MNFIFVSPNFPQTYWNFCDRLKRRGVTVLGIGDAPYESLSRELKESLTEYYKVDNLGDYAQMFRATAYFSFKYGKIDWLESNNEAWLESDARLRTDFNISTGALNSDIKRFKSKAEQKKYYAKAGVPTARQVKLPAVPGKADMDAALKFIEEVSYPVFVKPEIGVGAGGSYKLSGEPDFRRFLDSRIAVPYVMEEFVTGDIYSYDAIADAKGNPLFESSAHFPPSIADIANNGWDCAYHVLKDVPQQLLERGRATLKAFGVRSRFVHFEFFRLSSGKPGLGKKGDFVGLETNMRPAGGYTPDMMNFAHATDTYEIWAEMVTDGVRLLEHNPDDDHYCAYFGRRDSRSYAHDHMDVMARYGSRMAMQGRMPDAISDDLGNTMYMIHAQTPEEVEEFNSYLHE